MEIINEIYIQSKHNLLEKQLKEIKKDEVNNTSINSSNGQNENEIINKIYIQSKHKSKLSPETISPLAVSKENVQQSTEDLKKLSNDVNVIENQNGNNKFEFIAKVNLQDQNRSIEPTKKSAIIEENEVVNKKRKLSVTTSKAKFPDLEEKLNVELVNMRLKSVTLNADLIRLRAIAIAEEQNLHEFLCSDAWLIKFLESKFIQYPPYISETFIIPIKVFHFWV